MAVLCLLWVSGWAGLAWTLAKAKPCTWHWEGEGQWGTAGACAGAKGTRVFLGRGTGIPAGASRREPGCVALLLVELLPGFGFAPACCLPAPVKLPACTNTTFLQTEVKMTG